LRNGLAKVDFFRVTCIGVIIIKKIQIKASIARKKALQVMQGKFNGAKKKPRVDSGLNLVFRRFVFQELDGVLYFLFVAVFEYALGLLVFYQALQNSGQFAERIMVFEANCI